MLALSFPQSLIALHLYSLVSFLPVLTAVHVTKGAGLPETLQVKIRLSPSVIVMFSSGCTTGGAVKKKKNYNDHTINEIQELRVSDLFAC